MHQVSILSFVFELVDDKQHVNNVPFFLSVIYYGIGEIVPCIVMVIVQMNLPSKFSASYGELEKLMQKYKATTPGLFIKLN